MVWCCSHLGWNNLPISITIIHVALRTNVIWIVIANVNHKLFNQMYGSLESYDHRIILLFRRVFGGL